MIAYPFNTAQILTDDLFVAYGGQTGTSLLAQRNAAYAIAEKGIFETIGTLPVNITVTGTYPYNPLSYNPVVTDYGYVSQILSVIFVDVNGDNCTTTEHAGCSVVRSDTYGYVDVHRTLTSCSSCGSRIIPYSIRIAYNCGLSSGVVYSPNILTALTTVAQIHLNQMYAPEANESLGDIGVQEYRTQDYTEKRVPLGNTPLGNSPMAIYAYRLISNYIVRRGLYL